MAELTALREQVRDLHVFSEAMSRGLIAPESDTSDINVRFIPSRWKGAMTMRGQPMSHCPPEFLDEYCAALKFISQKEREERKLYNGKPVWQRTAADAARAARWAYRLRTGYSPATADEATDGVAPERSRFYEEAPPVRPNVTVPTFRTDADDDDDDDDDDEPL